MRFAAICLLPLIGLGLTACEKTSHEAAGAHGEDHGPVHSDGHGAAHASGPAIHHWSYEGDEGPDHWAQLGGKNAVCSTGARQSPVDLNGLKTPTRSSLKFDYQPSPASIQNNGHTVVVTPEAGGGIVVDGVKYTLKQYHFHSPSEHAIDGRRMVLETHFVHQNDEGDYLVVGVMSDLGAADPVVGSLWTYLPQDPGQPLPLNDILVNAQDLMPSSPDFYVYAGSLTTPPCTEGVTWMVFSTSLSVSPEQADALQRLIGPNSRPLQARHERSYLHVAGAM